MKVGGFGLTRLSKMAPDKVKLMNHEALVDTFSKSTLSSIERINVQIMLSNLIVHFCNLGYYTAPELYRNQVFDMSVDAYAFGFILYEVSIAFLFKPFISFVCSTVDKAQYAIWVLTQKFRGVMQSSDGGRITQYGFDPRNSVRGNPAIPEEQAQGISFRFQSVSSEYENRRSVDERLALQLTALLLPLLCAG
jgi:hypothetical protein